MPCDVDGNVLLHIAIRKDLIGAAKNDRGRGMLYMVPWKHTYSGKKKTRFPYRKMNERDLQTDIYARSQKARRSSCTELQTTWEDVITFRY